MQTNVRRFLEERNVIKANPFLASLRVVLFIWLFAVVAFLALSIFAFSLDFIFDDGMHVSATPFFSLPIPLLPIYSINFVLNFLQWRYWKGIEQRRFAAVHGERTLLAAEQPIPNPTSMRLPVTIKLRYHKEFMLLMTGAALLMSLLFAGTFTFLDTGYLLFTPNRLLFFLVIFIIFAAFLLALLFALFLSRLGRQQVEVTESGLTARFGGRTATVMWGEVRLFAKYATFGARESGAAMTFELSSATDIVRWTWVWRKSYLIGLWPAIAHDEYNMQMQALLSVVEAKTGLALYDLR
jgi:hypothetical protein